MTGNTLRLSVVALQVYLWEIAGTGNKLLMALPTVFSGTIDDQRGCCLQVCVCRAMAIFTANGTVFSRLPLVELVLVAIIARRWIGVLEGLACPLPGVLLRLSGVETVST